MAGLAVAGDLPLLHGLQQGALGFGGGPVDFVGQQHLGEDRPLVKDKGAGVLVENGTAQNITGQHVAGKLNPPELQPHAPGEHLGQRGLADAGNVLDQQVAPGKQTGQRHADLLFLAQHHLPDLANDGFKLRS